MGERKGVQRGNGIWNGNHQTNRGGGRETSRWKGGWVENQYKRTEAEGKRYEEEEVVGGRKCKGKG